MAEENRLLVLALEKAKTEKKSVKKELSDLKKSAVLPAKKVGFGSAATRR